MLQKTTTTLAKRTRATIVATRVAPTMADTLSKALSNLSMEAMIGIHDLSMMRENASSEAEDTMLLRKIEECRQEVHNAEKLKESLNINRTQLEEEWKQ